MGSLEDAQNAGRSALQEGSLTMRPLRESDLAELASWWTDPERAVLQQDVIRPRPGADVVEQFRMWSRNDRPSAVGFIVTDGEGVLGHVTVYGASLPRG